jgi:hypothetical protein
MPAEGPLPQGNTTAILERNPCLLSHATPSILSVEVPMSLLAVASESAARMR